MLRLGSITTTSSGSNKSRWWRTCDLLRREVERLETGRTEVVPVWRPVGRLEVTDERFPLAGRLLLMLLTLIELLLEEQLSRLSMAVVVVVFLLWKLSIMLPSSPPLPFTASPLPPTQFIAFSFGKTDICDQHQIVQSVQLFANSAFISNVFHFLLFFNIYYSSKYSFIVIFSYIL